jgi:hypothetical protein
VRQAEAEARACIEGIGLWRTERDERLQLRRRDDKPPVILSGPSLGAMFALGLVKL